MAFFVRDDISLYYEVHGEGYPILLIAPGGMRSAAAFWHQSEWNPIASLAPHFQVIAMDQRNAGQSTAPVSGDDGWHTYTEDHLALLDHLNISKAHVMGGCIGGPYAFGLMKAAPTRITGAILQQSIGYDGTNRQLMYNMFDSWAEGLKPDMPEVSEADWLSFRGNMYDGDFDFNVGREFVAQCSTPMLVLMGDDAFHPQVISRDIAEIAPNALLIEDWKTDANRTAQTVVDFLKLHKSP
ncbi:MAG: pimeloyl-ACP methyl ester carboxylesterase [Candidatus Azotimanducaceae bacterium]|jgi:pimeloyl-ACP methyl ester carboxylesterase